ncbi:MAG: ABC transporter transmembrane domain-containing protein [Oscillibacter sp.]
MPQKYFNTTSQGDILSRITNDVSTLQQGLTNSLPTIISAATQFVGCLIMMFVTEWRMALVALCITLLGMVLIVAHHVEVAALLHRPAEEPRRTQRLRGGDVFRP